MDKETVAELIGFVGYTITQFYLPRNGEPRIQIQDGEHWGLREVGLTVSRNKMTGELEFGVVRHFTDPESQAWFPDSEPWADGEMPVRED